MSLIEETDYGTPRSRAEKTVTLTIDGKQISVPEGTSIMRAAMEMGTQIPKLCATDMIESFGSFWASAFKEVIVFTLIIPVLLWRSLTTKHVEEEE